jgi:hypothetical protein
MIIEAVSRFKHETFTFEAGQKYDLPETWANYFIANGWAKSDGGQALTPLTQEHVLAIDDGTLASRSEI